jgi:Tfp pilus assembly protein PilX
MTAHGGKTNQRGDALLLSLFILLLMTLSLFATLHTANNDTQTSGALGWHTRGKQASEVVLKQTLSSITEAASSGDLEANLPNWLRTAINPTAPTAAYWATCWDEASNTPNPDSSLRCNKMASHNGFNVYVVVQTAGTAAGTASACNGPAQFYRIFLHAIEKSGKGSQVDTEAIYRLCK